MDDQMRVCVIGSGTRFLSGISYYTLQLTNTLAHSYRVSSILMRQLLPRRLYPGRNRVGAPLTPLRFHSTVRSFDGVDWHWIPSMAQALAFLVRERPNIVVFQWWTGAVLHSYLALAIAARILGARIVIEFHEVLDTGEARVPFVGSYVSTLAPVLVAMASGFVIHSQADRPVLEQHYRIGRRPIALIPHGPYNQYHLQADHPVAREAPADCCNLLFFGIIRPYKGLEDLIMAFDALSDDEVKGFWLTIIGETWEGWTLPLERISQSRHRDRITLVNRYVTDAEVAASFAGADAVVLPYHRSSASGPLHVAMSWNLPVAVSQVGGLTEVAHVYGGAVMVPPEDVVALTQALRTLKHMVGQRFADPYSWEHTRAQYDALFGLLNWPTSGSKESTV